MSIRKPIFDAVRDIKANIFNEPGRTAALDNLLDAFGIAPENTMHTLKDPDAFFAGVRKVTGGLTTIQVQTISALLVQGAHWSTGWMAYGLATAWTEARLTPIKEWGSDKYLSKYDTGRLAKILGNTPEADGDGQLYAGRGLPQMTGRANYTKASKALGIDLVKYPDRVLEPEIAVRVMIWGMETGSFTGRSLAMVIGDIGSRKQFIDGRAIINGRDKAELIADDAVKFQDALIAGVWA